MNNTHLNRFFLYFFGIFLVLLTTHCTKEKIIILSDEREILSFSLEEVAVTAQWNGNDIYLVSQDSLDLTQAYTPYIIVSDYASVFPQSGKPQHFSYTSAVKYTVKAQTGNTKEFFVWVSKPLSADKEILDFNFPNQATDIVFSEGQIEVDVYPYVDITNLTPIIKVSPGATVYPRSGEVVDFTNPVTYTITAQDGSSVQHVVVVSKNLSRKNDIEKFELIGTEQIFEREEDNLYIYVPYETDVTNIKTDISISKKASVYPESGSFVNFSNPQIYTVTASDGTSKNYLVTVKRSPWRKVGNGSFAPRDEHTVLVFKDKMWLLGGWIGGDNHVSEVWNTSDGKNWNLVTQDAPWKDKKSSNFIVFKNKIYALGGVGDDLGVWVSIDGANWSKVLNNVPWGKRYHPYVAVFRNKIWIMGGLEVGFNYPREYGVEAFSDVWSSEDGITWVKEKPYSQWPARGLVHGFAVLNDELYMYSGGIKGTVNLSQGLETISEYNDVWKSKDGLNWTLLTNSPGWKPRTHATITTFNNKLYLIAGSIEQQSNLSNEVWSSSDGIVWEQTKHTFFSPRHAASAVEYKGKLYLVAGFFVNDIWEFIE